MSYFEPHDLVEYEAITLSGGLKIGEPIGAANIRLIRGRVVDSSPAYVVMRLIDDGQLVTLPVVVVRKVVPRD